MTEKVTCQTQSDCMSYTTMHKKEIYIYMNWQVYICLCKELFTFTTSITDHICAHEVTIYKMCTNSAISDSTAAD